VAQQDCLVSITLPIYRMAVLAERTERKKKGTMMLEIYFALLFNYRSPFSKKTHIYLLLSNMYTNL
jgi:hypothetical protein